MLSERSIWHYGISRERYKTSRCMSCSAEWFATIANAITPQGLSQELRPILQSKNALESRWKRAIAPVVLERWICRNMKAHSIRVSGSRISLKNVRRQEKA